MDSNYAVAPGEYLQEWLDENETTQQQAADLLGCSRKLVNEIVNGRAPVTPDTATRLQRVTGISADSWLTFEAAYRAALARLHDQETLSEHADKIDPAVAKYLRAHGHTTATRREGGRLVADFLAFHRCGTFDAYTAQYESCTKGDFSLAALKESKKEPHPSAMSTWLRAAELTDSFQTGRALNHDPDQLRALLPALRERCSRPDASMLTDAAARLRGAGVLLLMVEPPDKFPLHGVTRWIDCRVPVIQQTARRGTDGFIVWTLFHEIGHILNDPRGELHLEYSTERKRNSAAEKAANAFAADTLFGPEGLAPFNGLTHDRDIRAAAREVGVSPGVAVLLMRRKRLLPYSHGSKLCVHLHPQYSP